MIPGEEGNKEGLRGLQSYFEPITDELCYLWMQGMNVKYARPPAPLPAVSPPPWDPHGTTQTTVTTTANIRVMLVHLMADYRGKGMLATPSSSSSSSIHAI